MSDTINQRVERLESQMDRFNRLIALNLTADEIEALEVAKRLLGSKVGRTVKLAGEIFEVAGHDAVLTYESRK